MKRILLAICVLTAGAASPAGAQTRVDLRTQGKNVDFSAAASTRPVRTGTALPSSCAVGEMFFKTDATPGQNLYACTAQNVWTLQCGAGGTGGASGMPPVSGQAGKVLSNDGTAPEWRSMGGDVSGAPEALTVTGIQGRPVSSTAPAGGQVLAWNETAGQWEPATAAAAGGANYSQAFASATSVIMPGASHGLGTANVIVDCYDSGTPSRRLEADSITVDPATFDITVTFASPQSGRCVVNGSGGAFAAQTTASNVFASGTTQTFQGALVASGADRTAPAKAGTTLPASCTPGDQFFKTNATAGQNLFFCTAPNTWTQMSGGGGGGTGGAVWSVFGRTGDVDAQVGDYSFSQIAGMVVNAQIAPGIDATKIGDGSVNNTKLSYLANVTSDVQAQLDGKAAAGHTHSLGGDLSGNPGSATVTGLQSRRVSSAAPADGQVLVWSSAANEWRPGAGGAGGGAGMAAQLGDLAVVQSSPTVLTIGANCSPATPCNVSFGNVVYSFTTSCTATISGGSGTAYVYVTNGGAVAVGHNATVKTSQGCLAQQGVTAFPAESVPLYIWTATNGTWDADGGRDVRGWLSNKGIAAGTGIATVESGGRTTVSVDSALVPMYITGTAQLNFPEIQHGRCASDMTFTLPGAAVNDAVAPGWPEAFEPGLLGMMRVSAPNTISVRVCNFSGATVDPINATFRATVVRSF
ncbi:MAG TPA: hypothetical protein PLP04_05125 [Bryobacteraceae bacterium]|nr:hypothetical protein [Bryobacteraceae bacterium]